MNKIIRIGMDTSKSVFQLHGIDAEEQPVLRKKLRRSQVLAFFAKLEPGGPQSRAVTMSFRFEMHRK